MAHPLIIVCLLSIVLFVPSCSTDSSLKNENLQSAVLKVGEEVTFKNNGIEGTIEALGPHSRRLTLNGEEYNFPVRARVKALGGSSSVKGKLGVYSAGESFYPHSGTQIVYEEHLKEFLSKGDLLRELRKGVRYSHSDPQYIISNTGLRIRINGKLDKGRLSLSLIQMTFGDKKKVSTRLKSNGSIEKASISE